ncbi:lipopolysaccharide biosynthesis protein, partial [Sphingomonas sp. SRS2]|uniref:lipopolysaccharide biosynthesis protein n=1 Tax=Sphingomonas sp. SRS2 TaxID=133190 RepID=UPI0006184C28
NKTVGIISVAFTISNALMIVYGSIGPLVFSHVAAVAGDEQKSKFIAEEAPTIFVVFCLSAAILSVIAPLFIPIIFGEYYLISGIVLTILLPGIVCSAMQRTFENYLFGRSHQGKMIWIHLSSIAIIGMLMSILGRLFGVYGLAWSITVGFLFSMLATAYLIKRIDHISIGTLLLPRKRDFDRLLLVVKSLYK